MNKFIFITLFLVENVFSVCLAQSYPYQKESIPVPQRVKDLLSRMTLEEKIAELNLIPYYTKDDSICRSLIRAGKVGAFLKANGAELNRSLQEEALKHSRLGIPLIFHEDVIHGYRTITPIPLAESCSWNPELVEQSAAMAAREAAAAGIQLTYAPMVDISYDPRWGRIMETSGEDAYLCGELAAARVRGFQGNDLTSPHTIAACVKHFAADDVLERINVQGVENLIDFCKNNGRRLIQISTVSVAGEGSDGVPPMSRVFCENDLYIGQNITNEYIRTKFLAERAVLEAVSEGLDGKVVRVGNLMSRNSDGEFQINFITNGFLRSLRGYAAVGKFPMGGMHEVAEFSPIDSTALAVLRLAQTDRRFTVFHACNSHHIYMADLIYAMRSYGFRIDIVRDEDFEAAVKEFAKTGQDSDAVSGLIAYTSHNENEIYTIDYSNRFTAQVLYRLDYKWPVTDDRYLENAIAALDRLTFFD